MKLFDMSPIQALTVAVAVSQVLLALGLFMAYEAHMV